MRENKYILFALFIMIQYSAFCSDWSTRIDSVYSLSSPVTLDVNDDHVKDIIVGMGFEDTSYRFVSGVSAFNGTDGSVIWNTRRKYDIYGTAKQIDINNDGVEELIFVGRLGELFVLNAKTGNLEWEFFDTKNLNPHDSGWYNFYDPQIIADVNNDGIKDVLISNGGNAEARAYDTINRYPGYIMIVSGKEGKLLKKLRIPDNKETYMSPVIHNFKNDNDPFVLVGTGGETTRGGFWAIRLSGLLNQDSTKYINILQDSAKGFIAAPSLADINDDNVLDIMIAGFNGNVYAINGADFSLIWKLNFPGYECYSSPAVGIINNDTVPDIAVNLGLGLFPSYAATKYLIIDGLNGNIIDSLITQGDFALSSPITGDFDADSKDEVLFSTNFAFRGQEKAYLNIVDFNSGISYVLDSLSSGFLFGSTPAISTTDNDTMLDLIFVETSNFTDNDSVMNIKVHKKHYSAIKNHTLNWSNYYGLNKDCKYYKNSIVTGYKENKFNKKEISVNYEDGMVKLPSSLFKNNFSVRIYNTTGELVFKESDILNIPFLSYSSGIYFCVIYSGTDVYTAKFSKVTR